MSTTTPESPPSEEELENEPDRQPRTRVVGSTFIADTTEQGQIRVRLRFKTKLLRQVKSIEDPEDQFFAMLDGIGDTDSIAKLDETDVFETAKIVEDFFKAYEEKHRVAVGESSRSST